MTWTAGQLVNELRHLDPDIHVYVLNGTPSPEVIRRLGFRRDRTPRIFRRICRVRAIRIADEGTFAYIEGGEAL